MSCTFYECIMCSPSKNSIHKFYFCYALKHCSFFLSAFICPDLPVLIVVEEGTIQYNIEVPGNEAVDPNDVVTSGGVHLFPNDYIFIRFDSRPNRLMDMEFITVGAATVTLTFTLPQPPDVIIQVHVFYNFNN